MSAASADPRPGSGRPAGWWEHPLLLAALVIASGLPVLMASVPPLIDLPGHMARYRVELDLGHSPALQAYYSFHWSLIGNLGVDLLVIPLSKLFGLELAVKIIVFLIPVLTATGLLWVAREVHGRIPPTTYLALPFAYNFALLFGFVNFALSMALALIAFGLWLRLGRLEKPRLRAALFVPISALLWLTHAFGWGALGILGFSASLVRYHDRGHGYVASAWRAGLQALSLAPPILLMMIWRSGHVAGRTTDWFNWDAKWQWIVMVLRDRWLMFDQLSLVFCGFMILFGAFTPRLGLSRHLTASAVFLAVVFALLPRIVMGSAYADMRLAPFVFAFALLAIRLKPDTNPKLATALALVCLGFFAARTGATMTSFYLYGRDHDRQLAALDRLPQGARLVSFAGHGCRLPWGELRNEHLPGMAVVRREAFSNDQWVMPGAQLISVRYLPGRPFLHDPSQVVVGRPCRHEIWFPIDEALALVPRDAFDFVWLIQPPRYDPRLTAGMEPVWRSGTSVLFRIVDRTPPEAALRIREMTKLRLER